MQSLTCPVPSNINPLQSNGFLFSIQKLPEISFFCQEANLPSLSLPAIDTYNPLSVAPIPGNILDFGTLSITFLIDEEMKNYIAVHNWLVGLGYPEKHEQFQNFINSRTDGLNRSHLVAGYSDGILQVLNSSNNPTRTVHFVDLFPVSLEQIQLQSTVNDTTYLAGTAGFRYTFYRFE